MTNFFSKANIYNFVWALIGALIIFLFGLFWNWWSGPNEVKIVGKPSGKDTTITIIRFEPTEISGNNDSQQIASNRSNNKRKPNYQFDPALIDSIINKTLAKQNKSPNDIIQTNITTNSDTTNIAPTYRPKFKMPVVVSGYTEGSINTYGSITINKREFNQADFIELTVDFYKLGILQKITPLFADIVRRQSENSVYQIWTDQFKPVGSKTKVKFSATFPPDTYELTIGFYILDELNTKYPTFYSRTFTIFTR